MAGEAGAMRLLFVYPTVYPDLIGGLEQRNFELASALARRGHRVGMASFQAAPRQAAAGLSFVSLGRLESVYNSSGQRSTRQALRFAARMDRLDLAAWDVVETASVPYVHLFPLARACRRARRPLLVTWYEYWGAYWADYVGAVRAPVYRLIERLAAGVGAGVTATSGLTAGRLAPRRGEPVDVVPCGLRIAAVQAAARSTVGSAAAGGSSPAPASAPPPLVFAGRLLADKRVDLLLRAVALLAPTGSGPLLTVFGDGPDRPRLERLAGELGVAERVVFRGYVPANEDVWAAFGAAQLAVQPSEREGFGLFPLEAMAAGLPVVYCSSPESAVPELVRDGVEGVETPAEPAALAATLARLLAGDGERARLAAAARERAASYDWDAIAVDFERRCAALLAPAPGAARGDHTS
jgi:glycosyltransferase involved in cell wall biosynthesis